MSSSRTEDLARITRALELAREVAEQFRPGAERVDHKESGDPVTDADRAVNEILLETLPQPGEGWLSEETVDDDRRLECSRVWVVDPIDGTKEFTQAIPEWCISVGLVEMGRAVAGGICNPQTGETIIGSVETGVTFNGEACRVSRDPLDGGVVLASRSEVKRGEWERFKEEAFEVVPMGSVAYKMGRVAAGLAECTWTLVPKHEWDVAAGVALIEAAGGEVFTLEGKRPEFNRSHPKFNGLLAGPGNGGDARWSEYLSGLVVRAT